MKIEFKNIKVAGSADRKTLKYSATCYVDGKRAFRVKGGSAATIDYIPLGEETEPLLVAAMLYVRENAVPSHRSVSPEFAFDIYVGEKMETEFMKKKYRKACKDATVFRVPGMPEGSYTRIRFPYSKLIRARVIGLYGEDVEFLNDKI